MAEATNPSSCNLSYRCLSSYSLPEVFTSRPKSIEYMLMMVLFYCWASNIYIVLAESVNLMLITYTLWYEWNTLFPVGVSSIRVVQLSWPFAAFGADLIL